MTDGAQRLRVVDANGSHAEVLVEGFHRATEPSWSSDGSAIAFAGSREAGRSFQVFVVRLR
jgi:Tol biopolymer transport system component